MSVEDISRDGYIGILNIVVNLFLKQNSKYIGICFIFFYILGIYNICVCVNVYKDKIFYEEKLYEVEKNMGKQD